MSRENVQLVLRGMRAGARLPEPDFATIAEVFASDHVFVPVVPGGRVGRVGADGYRAFLHEVDEVMLVEAVDVEGAVDLGPRTVLAVVSCGLVAARAALQSSNARGF